MVGAKRYGTVMTWSQRSDLGSNDMVGDGARGDGVDSLPFVRAERDDQKSKSQSRFLTPVAQIATGFGMTW